MNLIEAIIYLKEDENNIVTCIRGHNSGFAYRVENNVLQYKSLTVHQSIWKEESDIEDLDFIINCKFEIYKEQLNFKEACIQMSNGKKVKHGDDHYTIRKYHYYGSDGSGSKYGIFKNDEHLSILEVCELIDLKFEVVE